jgi:hypothetical protein
MKVKEIADLVGRPLVDGTWKYREGSQPPAQRNVVVCSDEPLVRITNKEGKISKKKFPGKRACVVQRPCFLCRLWGDTENTQWMWLIVVWHYVRRVPQELILSNRQVICMFGWASNVGISWGGVWQSA